MCIRDRREEEAERGNQKSDDRDLTITQFMASYIHCQRLRPDIFPEIVMLPGKDIEEKFKLSRLMGHSRKTQWSPNGVPYILEPQQGQEFESYVVISVNNTQQISRTSHSSYRSFIRKSLEIPTLECYEKF